MWSPLILIILVTFSIGLTKSELIDPEWQDIISAGGMHLGHGRTKRFVELNKTQPNIPHQACLLPNGKAGHCRHLHYCIQEDFERDFVKFMDYLCIIQQSSIGVCCPDDRTPDAIDAVAGDLPATAPRDENGVSLKIDRAENRGCGLSTRTQAQVTGASPANPREYPWMASVTPEGSDKWCGGSLITDRHVLSAAHCTYRYEPNKLFVRLGEYDFKRTNDSRSYNFRVIEKREHEMFDSATNYNDIVILKVHRAAVFNTYVWPICLPPRGLELDNAMTTLIAFSEQVFNETLCAGDPKGGKDACQFDSGGPLMYQMSSGRWTVVGVVSWGVRCGEPDHPGLYSRVDQYLEWILRNAVF